jgi:transmembrane sensor
VAPYLAWREGWLVFVDAPLPEVLAELGRWHAVAFTLGDSTLAARVLTMRLPPASLDATRAVLEAALDVHTVRTSVGVRLERAMPARTDADR